MHPVLDNRTLLFTHYIYIYIYIYIYVFCSLHRLIPDSQSNLLLPSFLLSNHKSVGPFLFCRQVHLCHILDSTYK